MADGSDDPLTPTDRLNQALMNFTICVGEAVPDICSYGLTIGDSYVPFDPDPDEDCDDDDAACSQIWVRVMSVTPTSVEAFGNDCATVLRLELEVGVLRCFEIMEDGEAPTASMVMAAAVQAMEDMNAIRCAAMQCDDDTWDAITTNQWTPTGPLGGQYGGLWTFTVEF